MVSGSVRPRRCKASVLFSGLVLLLWFFPHAAAVSEAAGEGSGKPVVVKAQGLDHAIVCVKSLDEATKVYERYFEPEVFKVKPLALTSLGVRAAALNAFGIELVEAGGGEAARFLERMGDGLWGVAFRVPDLDEAVAAMETHGLRPLAREGDATRSVAVFDPKDTFGVLIKLIQYTPFYPIADLDTVEIWKKRNPSSGNPAPAAEMPKLKVEKINHAILIVKDLPPAMRFFSSLFGSRFYDPGTRGFTADGLGIELLVNPNNWQLKKSGTEGVFAFLSLKISGYEQALDLLAAGGGKVALKRILPNRKVALVIPTPLNIGLELIEYRPLAHPIVTLEMEQTLRGGK